MSDLTREQINELFERSKGDRAIIVGSEVRMLCGTARRAMDERDGLRTDLEAAKAALEGACRVEHNWIYRMRLDDVLADKCGYHGCEATRPVPKDVP